MTKADFLAWLSQFKFTRNIRAVIEKHVFSAQELDNLKNSLVKGGRLKPRSYRGKKIAA